MSQLHLTNLNEGETILFGPSRRASHSDLSVKSEQVTHGATHTSFRTVCITNQRVIVESGDSHIHFPNDQIQRVIVHRNHKKGKLRSFNILAVQTSRGQRIKVEIVGLSEGQEALLKETFPGARIEEDSGLKGLLRKFV